MLTQKQKHWLNHLSNEKKVLIVPFDPTSEDKFQKIKSRVLKVLGKNADVQHRGSSNLKVMGQDEIDVYIPVPPSDFDILIPRLSKEFGEPRSTYPLERVRFSTFVNNKHIDLFLINKEHNDWINGLKFEEYLKAHPKSLEDYSKLKADCNGLSVQEYYTRKNIFINEILAKAA